MARGADPMAEAEAIAVTTLRRRETEGPGVAEVGPGNFRRWEEEAEEIMAAEAVVAEDSPLGADRPVRPEEPPEFLPVAAEAAGRETTRALQRM